MAKKAERLHPFEIYDIPYSHLAWGSGFLIKQKPFKQQHACMDMGNWCWLQIRQQGFSAINKFLKHKLYLWRKT